MHTRRKYEKLHDMNTNLLVGLVDGLNVGLVEGEEVGFLVGEVYVLKESRN